MVMKNYDYHKSDFHRYSENGFLSQSNGRVSDNSVSNNRNEWLFYKDYHLNTIKYHELINHQQFRRCKLFELKIRFSFFEAQFPSLRFLARLIAGFFMFNLSFKFLLMFA